MMILTLAFSFIILFRVAGADHTILKQLGGWAEPLLVASNLTSLVRRQEEECQSDAPVELCVFYSRGTPVFITDFAVPHNIFVIVVLTITWSSIQ